MTTSSLYTFTQEVTFKIKTIRFCCYEKIISIILSLLLVLNAATVAFAQETTTSENLDNEATLHQYEGQSDDDIAELTNEIIDEKGFSAITNSRSPVDDSIAINAGEFSKNSADQSTRRPSLDKNDSGSGISTFSESPSLFNTDPNSAIFLSESYYGLDLYDLAGAADRWYYFSVTGTNKISLMFQQEANGDYDLYLYKLNGSNLSLVAYSAESGMSELINYIADGGTYFIRVNPYMATTEPYYFGFMLNVINSTNFDSYELNETPDKAGVFANTINTNASIDNALDEDWYRLDVTTAKTKKITVANVPSGNHYAVFLYDSNFNSLGSYYADGKERLFDAKVGQYYIRVLSMTGHFTTTKYSLKTADYVVPIYTHTIQKVRLEWGEIHTESKTIYVENGGYLLFDMTVDPIYWADGIDRVIIALEIREEGYTGWFREDILIGPGSNQYIFAEPYKAGYPRLEVKINLVSDMGTVDVSGTVQSFPR